MKRLNTTLCILGVFVGVILIFMLRVSREPFQTLATRYSNDSCRNLTTVDTCIAQSFCGWCPDRNRCVEVDTAGTPRDRIYLDIPSDSKCDPSKLVRRNVTTPTTYANDICKTLTTQQSCISSDKCGWCPDRKRCVEMDEAKNPRDTLYSDIPANEKCSPIVYIKSTAPSQATSFGRWNVEQTTKTPTSGSTVLPQTYSPPPAGACPPMNPATRTSIQSQLNRVPDMVKEIDRIRMLGGTLSSYSKTTIQINTAKQLNDAVVKLQSTLIDVQQKLSRLL